MLPGNEWCEAEGSENLGRVIEPRNRYSCGHKDTLRFGKADAFNAAEGGGLDGAKASRPDTTGV